MASLSDLDCQRFGIRVAKAKPESEAQWRDAIEFCRRQAVQLLIARIDASRMALAQHMEAGGAFLADVLVVYRSSPVGHPPVPPAVRVRPCEPRDADAVRDLARKSFRGYYDHYHNDRRLPRSACDEVYADWAYRSCVDRGVADEVLIAEHEGRVAGFAALRLPSPLEADGMLFGVDPDARQRGVFGALVAEFLAWSARRGARAATYVTQLANAPVQKVLVRAGFVPERTYLTFHRWFGATGR